MKKILLLVCCLFLGDASAQELEGVKLDDKVRLGNMQLVLNGAGVRSVPFFKVYVIGLYVAERQHDAGRIMADGKPKRIAMHIVIEDAGTERFLAGFRRGIERNHNAAELATLRERMEIFDRMFGKIKRFRRGDVITFDWQQGRGTRVSMNGSELGRIVGDDFYRALLAIWIGGSPSAEDVKKALLGG